MTHLRTAYKNIQHLLVVNTSTVEIAVNQALFTDSNRPVYDDYADVLENQYDADFIPVPFSNRAKAFELINGHVKDATRGKISEIVTFDDLQDAQMILLSALFFKGQWKVSLTRRFISRLHRILIAYFFFFIDHLCADAVQCQ